MRPDPSARFTQPRETSACLFVRPIAEGNPHFGRDPLQMGRVFFEGTVFWVGEGKPKENHLLLLFGGGSPILTPNPAD